MEQLYNEIREDPLYKRLFALANVYTAEQFGLDVPKGAYEEMAESIETADDWMRLRARTGSRLRRLTLPRVADVEAGLASYIETRERAEELESKIERTDELIDEIVYELYGLTDDEIDIV